MALLRREIPVAGRDYCDMAGDYARPIEDFEILNVMLPRRYHPPLADNIYERRAADVARQLCGDDLVLDYDQLVAKPPPQAGRRVPLAPGSRLLADHHRHAHRHVVARVRRHARRQRLSPLRARLAPEARSAARTCRCSGIAAAATPSWPRSTRRATNPLAELHRGDVTVHHERTLHGSGGNASDRWRRGYVVAFRARATVAEERALGFSHSHNDDVEDPQLDRRADEPVDGALESARTGAGSRGPRAPGGTGSRSAFPSRTPEGPFGPTASRPRSRTGSTSCRR